MRLASPIRRAILASAASILVQVGCGGVDGRVPLFPASGKVLVDGQAVGGVQVRFTPAGAIGDLDALRPTAVSGEDGGFRLGTYGKGDGAPAGRYKVTLYLPDSLPNGSNSPGDLLGGRYIDPGKTPLGATINPGENRLESFAVQRASNPVRPRPTPVKSDNDGVR